jgi:carboxypeptidase family protein
MNRSRNFPCWLSLVGFVGALGILVPAGLGQTVSGTMAGTVTDQSGATVPGVKIVVTNAGTQLNYEATTNDAGQYVVPFLPPGEYTVTAERSGFKKQVVSGVTVQVEQRISYQRDPRRWRGHPDCGSRRGRRVAEHGQLVGGAGD